MEIWLTPRYSFDGNPLERLQRDAERAVVQANQAVHPRRCADAVALFGVVLALYTHRNTTACGHRIIHQTYRCRTTHRHRHDAGREDDDAAQHEERQFDERIV